MCSERSVRPSAVAALALVALLAACGKKGDPIPPPRAIPATTTDLTVRQRADRVRFELAYPRSTIAGLPLSGLESVTLYELEVPAPAAGTPLAVAPEQMAAARPLVEISGPTLGGAVAGDRIRFDTGLPDPLPEPPRARVYAVRTKSVKGERSALSNTVALVPRAAPTGPDGLEAKPLKNGILVSWEAVEGTIAGYAVLRRPSSQEGWWGEPVALLDPTTTSWLDADARYGQRWVYTVLVQLSRTPPIESAPRAEREVDYRDTFAPEPPPTLRALALPGEVRLVWEASPDPDVTGYQVERATYTGEFELVARVPGGRLEHVDEGLESGATMRYRVRAEDGAGNVSEPGRTVEARVP